MSPWLLIVSIFTSLLILLTKPDKTFPGPISINFLTQFSIIYNTLSLQYSTFSEIIFKFFRSNKKSKNPILFNLHKDYKLFGYSTTEIESHLHNLFSMPIYLTIMATIGVILMFQIQLLISFRQLV